MIRYFQLMANYALSHHKYRMGYGSVPSQDLFYLMNHDIMDLGKQAATGQLANQEFYTAIQEFPVFVQNMIKKIITQTGDFKKAMEVLGREGIQGFRDGTRMHSPPAVITEFLGYIRELPDYVLASSARFQQAASSLGKAFITGFEGSIQNIHHHPLLIYKNILMK